MDEADDAMALLQRYVFDADLAWATQRARFAAALMARPVSAALRVDEVEVGGVACRRLTPEGAHPGRAVVYAHGGGYCVGTPAMGDALAERVAPALGAAWYGVDYRLAPEHPAPAAVEDVAAVLRALGAAIGVGDSAGAGALVAAAADGAPVVALALVCPWLDLTAVHPTPGPPPLSGAWLDACARAYARDGRSGPVASPGLHPWRVGAPTLVVAADGDPLVGDARALAGAHGVEVREWSGARHDFALLAGDDPAADEAAAEVAEFLGAATGWAPTGFRVTG